mmetsp:Transcript_29727/g.59081  ORF Transcript_29727/g.59081 Transcript_29727/m.59081 type:complete len:288 (-) Transcript_29727:765-1628(-)
MSKICASWTGRTSRSPQRLRIKHRLPGIRPMVRPTCQSQCATACSLPALRWPSRMAVLSKGQSFRARQPQKGRSASCVRAPENYSEAQVALVLPKHRFHIKKYTIRRKIRPQPRSAHLDQVVVGHRQDHRIVVARRRRYDARHLNAIGVAQFSRVGPWVKHIHVQTIALQVAQHIQHLGVSDICAILLESQTQQQHAPALHPRPVLDHFFDQQRHSVAGHAVIDLARHADDVGDMACCDGLVNQVIGIDPDTVPPHQTGRQTVEIPLGGSGVQHRICVDIQMGKDDR